MKPIASFLLAFVCAVPFCARAAGPVATTAGNNLTAYNPGANASNNNAWNVMLNARNTGGSNAKADFGNCNALIMRCAQPKCSGGGCTDMNVAASIVSGCVNASSECKKYGDELVSYMSAQLVASSQAKINEAQIAAQNAAAAASAQANAQQMATMQQQMQQMQDSMAAQNAQQMAAMQAALDEQKQLTADAIAQANAARESAVAAAAPSAVTDSGLTVAQTVAAENGVSADVLAREQLTGQIMSHLENAETALKMMKTAMQNTFTYAGCDTSGNNCSGPKRVSRFKDKANEFFDPYNTVLDELYDALIMAQTAGVDIGDVYMMLEGSCNVWGQYICVQNASSSVSNLGNLLKKYKTTLAQDSSQKEMESFETIVDMIGGVVELTKYYNDGNCNKTTGKSEPVGNVRGGHNCRPGQAIPPEDDTSCTLQKMYTDGEQVQRNWLYAENGDNGAYIRVGCASSALDNSKFFRSRKKQAQIDIEVLQRIINQDAPAYSGRVRSYNGSAKDESDTLKYCKVGQAGYEALQKLVSGRNLTLGNKTGVNQHLCVTESDALKQVKNDFIMIPTGEAGDRMIAMHKAYEYCENLSNTKAIEQAKATNNCEEWQMCITYANSSGANWDSGACKCEGNLYRADINKCEFWTDYCARSSTVPDNVNQNAAKKCISCDDFCKNLDSKNYKGGDFDKTEQSGCKCK